MNPRVSPQAPHPAEEAMTEPVAIGFGWYRNTGIGSAIRTIMAAGSTLTRRSGSVGRGSSLRRSGQPGAPRHGIRSQSRLPQTVRNQAPLPAPVGSFARWPFGRLRPPPSPETTPRSRPGLSYRQSERMTPSSSSCRRAGPSLIASSADGPRTAGSSGARQAVKPSGPLATTTNPWAYMRPGVAPDRARRQRS